MVRSDLPAGTGLQAGCSHWCGIGGLHTSPEGDPNMLLRDKYLSIRHSGSADQNLPRQQVHGQWELPEWDFP